MELVVRAAFGAIGVAVWRGDDKDTLRLENALELAPEASLVLNVLDRLEAHHYVDRGILDWDGGRICGHEGEVRSLVTGGCRQDGLSIDIDAEDAVGDLSKEVAAVAFAAGYVEDSSVGRVWQCQAIP